MKDVYESCPEFAVRFSRSKMATHGNCCEEAMMSLTNSTSFAQS